ncbi:MAG: imidazole glycerol phosphate synthase subunit HisH [Acidimicrobiia bacterium]
MISVVDYRAGNAPSVLYAFRKLGLDARLVSKPDEVAEAQRLVLPGVGAAGATMGSLAESGILEPMTRRVRDDGVPFFGICIGLQLLFDRSEEGDTETLGWLPGTVRRFPDTDRVPQIGWNEVTFRRPHPVTADLPDAGHFYFVNSYHAVPADETDVLGSTDYSVEFCSVAARANIVATQFHAEKSGELGLRLLASFSRWNGKPC